VEYNAKLTHTVVAPANTAEGLFVDESGNIGGDTGVAVWGGESGTLMEIVIQGWAKVQLAAGETVVAGDYVKPNTAGKAVLDNQEGKFKCLEGGTSEAWVTVVLTGPVAKYALSGQAETTAGGEITIPGMTATGIAIVSGAETGSNAVAAVAGVGKITVLDDAGAAVNAKLVNYIIVSLA
jgi:hypothetical protein